MTRLLSLSGATLPHNIMPSNKFNELGYWEPLKIANFNDKILESLGSSWNDTFGPGRRAADTPALARFLDPACQLLAEEYDNAKLIVLKEPRINVLLPLWQLVLEKSGFSVHYVIMVRRPDEVARSLKLRDNIDRQKSLLLWANYMANSERLTRSSSRIFVHLDALFDDHAAVLASIERSFGFTFPRRTWIADAEATLDAGSRHHNMTGPLRLPEGLKPIGVLYTYLSAQAAGASLNDDVPNDVGAWLQSLDDAVRPLLTAAERDLTTSRKREAVSAQALNEAAQRLNALQDHSADLQSALAETGAEVKALNLEKAELSAAFEATIRRGDEALRVAKDEIANLWSAVRDAQVEAADLSQRLKAAEAQARAVRAELQFAQHFRIDLERHARDTPKLAPNGRANLKSAPDVAISRREAEEVERAARVQLYQARAEANSLRMGQDAVSAEAARLRAALKRIEGSLAWRMFGRFAGPATKYVGAPRR